MVDDDEHRMGRYKEVSSQRVGSHGGKAARTFHCHVRGVKSGGRGVVDYLSREGDYDDRDDLEYLAGDTAEFNDASAAVDDARRLKNGRTAENIVKTEVFELPLDSTPEQRQSIADTIVNDWKQRGYLSVAAVHAHGVQPHLHLAVTARPVSKVDGKWRVDRTAGRVPWQNKKALYTERQHVAATVNLICRQSVAFFAGRDKLMDQPGIVDRKPQKRLPQHDYRVDGVRQSAPVVRQERHAQHEARRVEGIANAVMVKAYRAEHRTEKLGRMNAVGKEVMRAAAEGDRPVRIAGKVYLPAGNAAAPLPEADGTLKVGDKTYLPAPAETPPQHGWRVVSASAAGKAQGAAERERKLQGEIEAVKTQSVKALADKTRSIFDEIGKAHGFTVPADIDSNADAQSKLYAMMRKRGDERRELAEAYKLAVRERDEAKAAGVRVVEPPDLQQRLQAAQQAGRTEAWREAQPQLAALSERPTPEAVATLVAEVARTGKRPVESTRLDGKTVESLGRALADQPDRGKSQGKTQTPKGWSR